MDSEIRVKRQSDLTFKIAFRNPIHTFGDQ